MQLYCDEPDCDRLVAGHGRGKCSTHLKQLQRNGKTAPIQPKLTAKQRALEACIAMQDADTMDDIEYQRREAAFESAVTVYADERAAHRRSNRIKNGVQKAKAQGVKLGRPTKASIEAVLRLIEETGSIKETARALRISRTTVHNVKKRMISEHSQTGAHHE